VTTSSEAIEETATLKSITSPKLFTICLY